MSFLSFHFPKRKDNADVYTHLRKLFSGFFALTSVFAELLHRKTWESLRVSTQEQNCSIGTLVFQ